MAIQSGDVTDEQIEAALVRAVLDGRSAAVVEALAEALRRRQRERAGNVVDIDTTKRR